MEIDHDEVGEGPSNTHPIEEEPGAENPGQLPPQHPLPPLASSQAASQLLVAQLLQMLSVHAHRHPHGHCTAVLLAKA